MKPNLILFFLFSIFTITTQGTEYYLNSVSGKDSNDGKTAHSPWKSLAKIEIVSLKPGDKVFFARGSSWSKAQWESVFVIDNNGTLENPVTFSAYGEGELPLFSNGGQVWNKGIKITGSYLVIENLKVINTGYCGFEIDKNSKHITIRKCEVEKCGMGVLCYGSDNLITENFVHDLKMIVDNQTPDTQDGGGDFGCVAFWLYGPKNEISYNRAINNRGHSFDYQFDGGFLEFYENCDSTYAHHNWADIGQGIAEGSNGHGNGIIISYNVFIEHMGMFAMHLENFKISGFRFENNTCITRKGTLWNNMFMTPNGMIVRNNIFVLGGDSAEKVGNTNSFTHTNNIYYLLDGAKMGSVVLGTGEKLVDPKFVDFENNDFRLQIGSPAIDSGIELGHKTDYNNKPVPYGKAPDIGAFEYEPSTGTSMIKTQQNEDIFSIWPNPANNKLNIKINSDANSDIKLKIINLIGQIVYSENIYHAKGISDVIPLHVNLSPGTYLVSLNSGTLYFSNKLVIE